MSRLAQTVVFSKGRRQVSIVLAVAGLMGTSGASGCGYGPGTVGSELNTRQGIHWCVGGPKFDPAGEKNVGNGHGQQFIGGQCLSAADCASGCCALPCGICSGPGAQFQAGKQGCGFGDPKPADAPAPRGRTE